MLAFATFSTFAGALFAACQALPALQSRQLPGPGCEGVGIGSFNTAHNFTLAAWNTTLPNSNNTGVPLVLGRVDSELGEGESFRVLSTLASTISSSCEEGLTWNLTNGVLLPNGPAMDGDVTNNDLVAGVSPNWTFGLGLPAPEKIFCALVNTSPNGGGNGVPVLAGHGDSDDFYLCPTNHGQVNVVFKPTEDNFEAYIFDECYAVLLQLIGLN